MKTLVCCLFSLFFLAQTHAQQLSVSDLFYCNSYQNIADLWLVDSQMALGKRMESLEGQYAHHVKDLVLINRQGLVVDSVSFKKLLKIPTHLFADIQQIWRVEPYTFFVFAGGVGFDVLIRNERLEVNQHLHEGKKRNELAPPTNYPNFRNERIVIFDNMAIGYGRKRYGKKNVGSAKDHENHPVYWASNIQNGIIGAPKLINPKPEEVTRDIFWDWKDWDIVKDRSNVFANYFSMVDGKVFFNVPRSNACYIYSPHNQSVSVFRFPEVKQGESFMHYYDYLQKVHYAVKKTDTKQYHLYSLTNDFTKAVMITALARPPKAIVDGKLHYIEEEKESKRNFKCHFLIEIGGNYQQKNTQILKGITVE